MNLNIKEGEYLVELARASIFYYLKHLVPPDPPKTNFPNLLEKRGVFCTLLTQPGNKLRGCIGLVVADKSLIKATIESSCSATQDPRFLPLNLDELNKITIELTILTQLQKISVSEPRDYLNEIKIGGDGLYLKYHYHTGVFLPQVPVEQKWNTKTYLSELCLKAGLTDNSWITEPVKLYKFQAQIFSEAEPDGKVFEKKLSI
jgi:hypothetical protein